MAVFDLKASSALFEQFIAAQEEEGAAITVLHDAMKQNADMAVIMALSEAMSAAHDKKMTIWSQLQAFRLDQ